MGNFQEKVKNTLLCGPVERPVLSTVMKEQLRCLIQRVLLLCLGWFGAVNSQWWKKKPFHCLLSTESHHRKNNKIMVKTDETEADTHLSSPPPPLKETSSMKLYPTFPTIQLKIISHLTFRTGNNEWCEEMLLLGTDLQ